MRTVTPVALSAAAVVALAGCLASCGSSDRKAGATFKTSAGSETQRDLSAPSPSQQPAASSAAPAPADHGEGHALHNVHRVGKIISGAVPESDAAFDELRAMGVKTIISVDGASPDVARAEARGMRYVHIPITYAEANRDQQLEIARAVRDLPGPVFVHCHHGKHRGPAAAASAAVLLGEVTAEEGVAFMKAAGTAPSYEGLYACVATASVAPESAIDGAPAEFPSVRRAQGFVAAMIEVDQAFEYLGKIRAAGWMVPKDHPDLVPAAEAGRLVDNLRFSHEAPRAGAQGDDLAKRMVDAIAIASALEEGMVRGAPKAELEASWTLVAASCKDCHAVYRDKTR